MRIRLLLAVLALCVISVAAKADWREAAWAQMRAIAEPLLGSGVSTEPRMDAFYASMVESLPAQAQAERSLQMAINQYQGASEYVIDQAGDWLGEIERSDSLVTLVATASQSPRIETRMAGYEVALAMVAVEKTPEQVDQLLEGLDSDRDAAVRFAQWHLGALAARGVERERIFQALLEHSYTGDTQRRLYAIQALGIMGGAEVVEPLLDIATHASHPSLRDRAFCGLAQSATLQLTERYLAVPGLFAIVDDPNESANMQRLAYQALREITGLHMLAEEPSLWRRNLEKSGLL